MIAYLLSTDTAPKLPQNNDGSKTTTAAAPTTTDDDILLPPATSAAPPQPCVARWSDWINKDSPDSEPGDVEKMTPAELAAFCPGGMVAKADCQTVDGIEYFSSGEILTCSAQGGLQCSNADNFPNPCSDYKIRYQCTCPNK